MDIGGTAKKIQSLAEVAETLVEQFKALRERVIRLESTTDETHERVASLESQVAYQQELLEAIAVEHNIDPAEYTREEPEESEDDSAEN